MSGVEASNEAKANQLHLCASCMNNVVQTFSHLQEQIERLKQDKAKLQEEMMMLREEQKIQKQVLIEEIRQLEEKLISLKKN